MKKNFTYGEITASLEEKKKILKKDTTFLNGKKEENIKNIFFGDFFDVYILMEDGNLFQNEKCIRTNVKEIWAYNLNTILWITKDNKIESDTKNEITKFIEGEYKDIVLGEKNLLALDNKGMVKSLTTQEECIGIVVENFRNVEEIGIEKKDYKETPYVIKNKEKKYLFVEEN